MANPISSEAILDRVLDADTWGLGGADISAKIWVRNNQGEAIKELGFAARSLQHDRPRAKSLIRFTAPADLVNVGFLQIQQKTDDDERHLFLPDLKKARRITGKLRSQSFMGTDFSYADLDRKELREGSPKALADETVGKFDCYHLEVTPRLSSPEYSKIELWIRKDNFLPIKWNMYGGNGERVKTLLVKEVKRIGGKWFLTRSVMTDLKSGRSTELSLERVDPDAKIADDEFTVRNLAKT